MAKLLSFLGGALDRRQQYIDQELEDMRDREKEMRQFLTQFPRLQAEEKRKAADWNIRYNDPRVTTLSRNQRITFANNPNMNPDELSNLWFSDRRTTDPSLGEQTTGAMGAVSASPPLSQLGAPAQPSPMPAPAITNPVQPNAQVSMLDVIFGRISEQAKVASIYNRLGEERGVPGSQVQQEYNSLMTGDYVFDPTKIPEGQIDPNETLTYRPDLNAREQIVQSWFNPRNFDDPDTALNLYRQALDTNDPVQKRALMDQAESHVLSFKQEQEIADAARGDTITGELPEARFITMFNEDIRPRLGKPGDATSTDIRTGRMNVIFGTGDARTGISTDAEARYLDLLEEEGGGGREWHKNVNPGKALKLGNLAMAYTILEKVSQLEGSGTADPDEIANLKAKAHDLMTGGDLKYGRDMARLARREQNARSTTRYEVMQQFQDAKDAGDEAALTALATQYPDIARSLSP